MDSIPCSDFKTEMQTWLVFSAWHKCLITVVGLIVGALRLRAVVRAAWRTLIVWSRLRCSVWSSLGSWDGWARLGFIFWTRPAPLALVVWLLRVGLPLHPSLLHWTVTARVVIIGSRRPPRATRLTAGAVPAPIGLAVRRNALPVLPLVFGSWPAVSLSVWEKVHSAIF